MKKITLYRFATVCSLPLLIYGIIQIKIYGVVFSGFIRPLLMVIFAFMVIILPKYRFKLIAIPIILNIAWILYEVISAVPLYANYDLITLLAFLAGNLPQLLLLIMVALSFLDIIKNRKINMILLILSFVLYTLLVLISFLDNFNNDSFTAVVLLSIYYLPNILSGITALLFVKAENYKSKPIKK